MTPFLICEFARDTLSNLVKERFGDDFPDIVQKNQIKFIFNYLKDLGAQTILLESDYVDRDYLEDYSRYYVKCFNRYGERCARIHFFSHVFDYSSFKKGLTENPEGFQKELGSQYLGFIVVKPLPKTFIGKTCLLVYPEVMDNPHKKIITRNYDVNLFGLMLNVRSIAFQEQDKVVSACATTAIWSALHAQKFSQIEKIPSSSEITISAINHVSDSVNSFPNNGLTNKQILRALDIQGFRNHKVELKSATNISDIFPIIQYFIDSDTPLILGCDVYRKTEGGYEKKGSHAVTVLGYKNGTNGEYALYVHDDRFGPFARVLLKQCNELGLTIDATDGEPLSWAIQLFDKKDDGEWKETNEVLVPDSMIVPTHPKVRIPIEKVINTCDVIREEVEFYFRETQQHKVECSFKITLRDLRSFRTSIISDLGINAGARYQALTQNSAKYMWIAQIFESDELIFSIAFDATDIPHGKSVTHVVVHDEESFEVVKRPLKNLFDEAEKSKDNAESYIGPLLNYLFVSEPKSYEVHLDETLGELRAPLRFKSPETEGGRLHTQPIGKRQIYFGRVNKSIVCDFPGFSSSGKKLIWAVGVNGELLIGEDNPDLGHPTLTGFKLARIAGELIRQNNHWILNSRSGRYSFDYDNCDELLTNALDLFLSIFEKESRDTLKIERKKK